MKQIHHIDLSKIKDPKFLKEMDYSSLNILADDIRKYIIDITSKNGGHLASNLGSVEATISLLRVFDFTKDKIVFDVGHQSYTYKILTGRDLSSLRKKDGISGFQKMGESIYDHYEAGHSSTSISAVTGMAIARDLNKEKYDCIAFIGDSSIVNGLAFEAINNNDVNKNKIIIIINDNEMSISSTVGGGARFFRKFSTSSFYLKSKKFYRSIMYKTKIGRHIFAWSLSFKNMIKRILFRTSVFDLLGYSIIGTVDGHNIRKLDKAFKRAKKADKSVIIHIKTKKGNGFPFAENDTDGHWHGVGPFDITTGKQFENKGYISWSKIYSNLLLEEMRNNDKIITILSATGFGSYMNQVQREFPNRTIDVGISEEHAATLASGLAVSNYHPVVSLYSTFLQRAYDEVNHDIARMNLNVTFLIDRAGLAGSDGETHQGIFDEEFLLGMPNVTICMASTKEEAKCLLKESFNNHGPFFIRYPKEDILSVDRNEESLPYGKWKRIKEGNEIAIISTGPILIPLIKELDNNNLDVTLINALYLKPIDEEMLKTLLSFETIIIYDTYGTINGFASYLTMKLVELNFKGQIISKAIPLKYIKQATIEEQREELGLRVKDIIDLVNIIQK